MNETMDAVDSAADSVIDATRHVLVYDGACSVCRASIDWLERWDTQGAISCVPYQDERVRAQFPEFSTEDLDREIHLVSPDGNVTKGARAVEEALRIARGAPPVAWLFRFPGGRMAARLGYRIFARNRHRFGCGDHCRVPEAS